MKYVFPVTAQQALWTDHDPFYLRSPIPSLFSGNARPFRLAELNQELMKDEFLPVGAREHYRLRPGSQLQATAFEAVASS
jgi:hypothetical protein